VLSQNQQARREPVIERKSDLYIRLSEQAASDIAKWPEWMQRNLKPLKVSVSDKRATKGAGNGASKASTP
jgi:hypothetical protein